MSEQFRIRQCEKVYLAVVEGVLSCSNRSYPTPLVDNNCGGDQQLTSFSTASVLSNRDRGVLSSTNRDKGILSHWLNTTLSTDRVSIVDTLPVPNTPTHHTQTKTKYVSAVLTYVPLHTFTPIYNPNTQHTLVNIALETGRKHQIRAQMSHIGHPIVGDVKYGALTSFPTRDIALHAYTLTIVHPVSQEVMTFVAPPPALWNKRFGEDLMRHIIDTSSTSD